MAARMIGSMVRTVGFLLSVGGMVSAVGGIAMGRDAELFIGGGVAAVLIGLVVYGLGRFIDSLG